MNKQTPSVITTGHEEQPSRTGTLLGGHGLAMLVGLQDLPKHPDPDLAAHIMDSLRAFSARLPSCQTEAARTRTAIDYLNTPSTRKWVAARVVTLLSHYFVAQQESAVVEAIAEDWVATLERYPAWALANACRWWLSKDNPDRAKKPLPGDIEARADAELSRVRAAQITVQRGVSAIAPPAAVEKPDPVEWWTDAERERRRLFAESVLRSVRSGTSDTGAQAAE